MQVKVPKFIDIEDRVVFGLTWRQVVYMGGAAGAALMFFTFFEGFLAFPLSLITFAVGAAFAFAKINDRPFKVYFLSVWHYHSSPRRYFWKKERPSLAPAPTQTEPATIAVSKSFTPADFRQLARSLDSSKRGKR